MSNGVSMKALEAAGFKSGPKSEEAAEAEERRAAIMEQRAAMLKSIMTSEARERLARVAIVKPENARAIEDHLLQLYRSGSIREQVTEGLVIKLLEQVTGSRADAAPAKKVVVQRKRRDDDDDDNDDDL